MYSQLTRSTCSHRIPQTKTILVCGGDSTETRKSTSKTSQSDSGILPASSPSLLDETSTSRDGVLQEQQSPAIVQPKKLESCQRLCKVLNSGKFSRDVASFHPAYSQRVSQFCQWTMMIWSIHPWYLFSLQT